MQITGTIDARELAKVRETFALYALATKKDMEAIINHFMKQAVIFSSNHTTKADKGKMEAELKRILSVRLTSKTGKALKRPSVKWKDSTLARAIVVSRLRKQGKSPADLTTGEIDRRTRMMISSRMKGIGFHKAGWIPAFREFGAPLRKAGAKAFGPPKGEASKAKETRLSAAIKNKATGVERVQSEAVARGVSEALADMQTYAKRKLAESEAKMQKRLR